MAIAPHALLISLLLPFVTLPLCIHTLLFFVVSPGRSWQLEAPLQRPVALLCFLLEASGFIVTDIRLVQVLQRRRFRRQSPCWRLELRNCNDTSLYIHGCLYETVSVSHRVDVRREATRVHLCRKGRVPVPPPSVHSITPSDLGDARIATSEGANPENTLLVRAPVPDQD